MLGLWMSLLITIVMDTNVLKEVNIFLDEKIETEFTSDRPGIALVFAKDGEVIFQEIKGMADLAASDMGRAAPDMFSGGDHAGWRSINRAMRAALANPSSWKPWRV